MFRALRDNGASCFLGLSSRDHGKGGIEQPVVYNSSREAAPMCSIDSQISFIVLGSNMQL